MPQAQVIMPEPDKHFSGIIRPAMRLSRDHRRQAPTHGFWIGRDQPRDSTHRL
jgi:hypothetical protein